MHCTSVCGERVGSWVWLVDNGKWRAGKLQSFHNQIWALGWSPINDCPRRKYYRMHQLQNNSTPKNYIVSIVCACACVRVCVCVHVCVCACVRHSPQLHSQQTCPLSQEVRQPQWAVKWSQNIPCLLPGQEESTDGHSYARVDALRTYLWTVSAIQIQCTCYYTRTTHTKEVIIHNFKFTIPVEGIIMQNYGSC